MRPPKEILEKAENDGALHDADMLVSAAYLMTQLADWMYLEAGDRLKEYGLLLGEHKRLFSKLLKAADEYSTDYSRNLMCTDAARQAHIRNFETYKVKMADMLGISEIVERLTLQKMQLTEEEKQRYLLSDNLGNKVRVSFTTHEVILAALDAIAQCEGRPRHELINKVLHEAIIGYQREAAFRELRR